MEKNPWEKVELSDYENHMSQSDVYQLQTLDTIMKSQFSAYPVTSVAILGVAGGNGLGNLVDIPTITDIYGIDINASYLAASASRHPKLGGRYATVLADVRDENSRLPHVDLVVANLFIEYVGCTNFGNAIVRINPSYVSCVIQIDPADSFVSDSPYTARLEILDSVHASVDPSELRETMRKLGYTEGDITSTTLPNGKIFLRLDFCR